jgi:hypothetical protein
MAKNRVNRRTAQQIERDKALRAKYQATRPSLEELQKSGDYSPPVSQSESLAKGADRQPPAETGLD